jgi:hypothetical protein
LGKNLIKAKTIIIEEKKVLNLFDQGSGDINFSPGGYGGEDNAPQGGGFASPENMKKYMKLGGILIVVLIIAFIAYSIISSQQTIRIILVDPNGDDLAGTLSIRDSSQKLVTISPLGKSSSFNANLWPGTYTATAKAENYKATTQDITIPSNKPTISINLIRDLSATMSTSLDEGANEIYEGQTISGSIQITNTGNTFNVNDIVFSGEAPLSARILPSNIGDIPAGSAPIIDFNLSVSDTNAKLAGKSKTAKFSFKIKGSAIKSNEITMQVLPAVAESKVTLTGATGIVNTNLSAGTQITVPLKINNTDTAIPLTNITIRITPTAGSEKTLSWLSFNQSNTKDKTLVTLDAIAPKGGEDLTLFVDPPVTAKIDDAFTGTLSIESPSIKGIIEKTVQFKVKTAKSVSVIYSGTNEYTINCKSTGGTTTCTALGIMDKAYLENTGNIEVTNITLTSDLLKYGSDGSKCQSWFTLGTKNIDSLTPKGTTNAKEPIQMTIDIAQPELIPASKLFTCDVKWQYVNPLEPTKTVTDDKPIVVKITVT